MNNDPHVCFNEYMYTIRASKRRHHSIYSKTVQYTHTQRHHIHPYKYDIAPLATIFSVLWGGFSNQVSNSL